MFKSDGLAYMFYTKSNYFTKFASEIILFFGFDLEKHQTDISVYSVQECDSSSYARVV